MSEQLDALEMVRHVAIGFLKENKPINWEGHIEELKRGALLAEDGSYRIGRWSFDFGSLVLLRDADIATEVRRYGMLFRNSGGVYTVVDDFWERETFDFE